MRRTIQFGDPMITLTIQTGALPLGLARSGNPGRAESAATAPITVFTVLTVGVSMILLMRCDVSQGASCFR